MTNSSLRAARLFAVLIALTVLLAVQAVAIPNEITLQGKLTGSDGYAASGTYNMSFKIYDSFTNGTVLYEVEQNITTNANGVYDVILRNINLNFSGQYYLGITVSTDEESVPRINLTSSPYAFRSNVSEGLNPVNAYTVGQLTVTGDVTLGSSTSAFQLTSQKVNISSSGNIATSGNATFGQRLTFMFGSFIDNFASGFLRLTGNVVITNNLTVGDGALFVDSNNSKVGIGTAAPNDLLEVAGNVRVAGSLNATALNASKIYSTNYDIGWTNLSNYPAACDPGEFMTAVGDTLTCTSPGEVSTAAGGWSNDSVNTRTNLNVAIDTNVLVVNTSTNRVGINTASMTNALDVVGDVRAIGLLNASSLVVNNTLFVNGSMVGIGTTTPGGKLEVSGGNLKMTSGNIVLNGNYLSGDGGNEGVYIDGSGLVGIGTPNAGSLLSLFGPGPTSTMDGQLKIESSNSTGAANTGNAIYFAGNSGDFARGYGYLRVMKENGVVGNYGTYMSFGTRTNGVGTIDERVRITSTGNVGIGTTAPSTLLHLSSTSPLITINDTDTSQYFTVGEVGDDLGIYLNNTNTKGITIDQDGNVGIGTASPNDLLEVAGNVRIAGSLNASSINATKLNINNTLFVNGSRVGIGTNSPGAKLEVGGGAVLLDNLQPLQFKDTAGTARNFVTFDNGGEWQIGQSAVNAGFHFSSFMGELLTIFYNGNVGIGTTTPNDLLEVTGNVRVAGSLNATSINATRFYARNGTAALPSFTFAEDTDTGIVNNGIGGNNISIVTGGSARMTIDSSGNVGIGTTEPAQKLDVVGYIASRGGSGGILIAPRDGSGTDEIIYNPTGDDMRFYIGGDDRVTIKDNGNVGIGQTSPNVTLGVSGSANITGMLFATNANITNTLQAGTLSANTISGNSIYSTSYDIGWTNLSNYPAACAPGEFMTAVGDTITCTAPGAVSTAAGGWSNDSVNTRTNLNVIIDTNVLAVNTSTNRVGINTASPAADLDVLGNIQASGSVNATSLIVNNTLFVNGSNVGIGTASPGGKFHSSIGSSGIAPYTGSSGVFESNTHNYVNILAPDGFEKGLIFGDPNSAIHGGIIYDVAGVPNADTLSFRTAGIANRMVILGNGNVGIGTSSPQTTLEVVGTINATSIKIGQQDVQVEVNAFKIANYSSEYGSTGFKASNFTSSYGTEYGSTGFRRSNITEYLGGAGANDSIVRSANASFVTSQSVGGEVSGTVGSITIGPLISRVADAFSITNLTQFFGFSSISDANVSIIQKGNTSWVGSTVASLYTNLDTDQRNDLTNNTDAVFNTLTVNQNLYIIGNLTNVNVNNINVNGSILPSLDSTFDLGNASAKWQDANFSGTVQAGILSDGSATITGGVVNAPTIEVSGSIVQVEANAFKTLNLTNYFGDASFNATVLRKDNTSFFSQFSKSGDFDLRNISNATLVKGDNATLALWNTTSTAIFQRDVSKNVGIGTTTPEIKMHINTTGWNGLSIESVSGNPTLYFKDNDASAGAKVLYIEGTGNVIAFGSLNDAYGAAISLMTLTRAGLLGIGTSSPNDLLEVVGNVRVAGSLNATSINATRFYAQNGTAALPSYTFAEDTNTGLRLGSADNVSIVTGGSDRVTVDASGNVGIGVTNLNQKLKVGGGNALLDAEYGYFSLDTNWGMYAASVGGGAIVSNTALIFKAGGADSGQGWIFKDHTGENRFEIKGATGQVYIPGSVGIGSATPGAALEVVGDAKVSGQLNVTSINATSSITVRGNAVQEETPAFKLGNFTSAYDSRTDRFGNDNTSTLGLVKGSDFNLGNISNNTLVKGDNASISLWNTSSTAIFPSDANKNVGIGTTSPNDLLEVTGNVRVAGSLNATSINATRIFARNGTAALPSFAFSEDADTGIINNGLGGNNISIVTGGSARMTVDGSGNVGIGTASPANILDIRGYNPTIGLIPTGTSQTPTLRFYNNGPASVGYLQYDTGVSTLTLANTAGNLILQPTSGNVGIGTTAPLSTLHVNSSSADGALRVTNVSGSTIFFVNGSSGNVGIGTTRAGYPLVVQTSSTGTTVNSNIVARLQSNGEGYASTLQLSDGVTYAASITMLNGDLNFLVPGFGIVPSLIVKATTGNVGIGQTSPNVTLGVSGSSNITGVLYSGTANITGTVQAARFSGDGSLLTGLVTGLFVYSNSNVTEYLGGTGANDSLIRSTNTTFFGLFSKVADAFSIGNLTSYFGDASFNATVIRSTNTSWFNTNFNSQFGTANTTSSLWNSTSTAIFQRDLGKNVGIGTATPSKALVINSTTTANAITLDPSASTPAMNTTGGNMTITSASGSVIIRLG